MDSNRLMQLGIFVAVLVALNFFFQLHISIIGSLALTVGLSFLFGMMRR